MTCITSSLTVIVAGNRHIVVRAVARLLERKALTFQLDSVFVSQFTVQLPTDIRVSVEVKQTQRLTMQIVTWHDLKNFSVDKFRLESYPHAVMRLIFD